MIQGGDFTDGDGTGGHAIVWSGHCGPDGRSAQLGDCDQTDWTLPDEANNGYLHVPCTISMAKTSQPNTGGSQFFLIPEDSTPSHLDGVHTVFGTVTSGCEHVTAISEVPTGQGDVPENDVTVESVTFVGSEETDPWYKFW
jgi:cyclophilin family peptidyl-prolyl cis-trans isomerase